MRNTIVTLFLLSLGALAGFAGTTQPSAESAASGIEPDESSAVEAPVSFVRAVDRKSGRLIAQAEISIPKAVQAGVAMGRPGGTDDLEAAVKAFKQGIAVDKDDLVFVRTLKVGTVTVSAKDSSTYRGTIMRADGEVSQIWGSYEAVETDLAEFFDTMSAALIPKYHDKVSELKARMELALLLGGKGIDKKTGREFCFFGPLRQIAYDIQAKYTTEKTGEGCPWLFSACIGEREYITGRLAGDWFDAQCSEEKQLQRETGYFANTARYTFAVPKGTYLHIYRNGLKVQFNYDITIKWDGKRPAEAKVTIDLTPMKNRLYKVRPADQK